MTAPQGQKATGARGRGISLSANARALLVYINTCEFCPCYREMREAVGVSQGGVQRLLQQLEERGYIRRLPRKVRAIEVLAPPPPIAAPELHVIYGPGHWEERARLKRAQYAREAA